MSAYLLEVLSNKSSQYIPCTCHLPVNIVELPSHGNVYTCKPIQPWLSSATTMYIKYTLIAGFHTEGGGPQNSPPPPQKTTCSLVPYSCRTLWQYPTNFFPPHQKKPTCTLYSVTFDMHVVCVWPFSYRSQSPNVATSWQPLVSCRMSCSGPRHVSIAV